MIISDILYIKNMKRLYRATYHAVIYAEFEDVPHIAGAIGKDALLDLESLEEIEGEADLPPEWGTDFSPIVNDEGALHESEIGELLERLQEINPVKKEIASLQECVTDIQKRIKQLEAKL